MYSGGPSSTTFTGIYDSVEQEYVYPSARQNAVIAFSDFYLSATDGDLTTDGLSISTQTGEATDITIGNAPSAVLNATMLNPNGLMETLTWGDGTVYIGAQTASAAADTYASLPCHVYVNSIHYGINSSGNARRGSTTYTLGGTPLAVIANSTGTDVLFVTDTKIGRYNGSFSIITSPTDYPWAFFMAAKFTDTDEPIGIALNANGCPAVFNNVTANTKVTYDYVPMGIFDFSNVDAFGSVFTVEAYDKMTVFDADATDWINSLDFSGGLTIPNIINALVTTEFGMVYSIDANAVNRTSINWSTNPVTSYSVTYRQLLKWLAEGMACNVRIGRTGVVEFYCLNSTSVGTVTPDTIVNGSRTKYRYAVPAITHVVCYNTLGAGYKSTGTVPPGGVESDYYIVGNPFIDPSGSLTPINNIRYRVDDILAYYPTTINVACSDPHIDAGDFIMVEDREGNTTYLVPIMHQTLYWSGMCKAEFTATGNQVRAIPSSMENSDLASVVDSNPSAVVNKIQAVGISADWITTGKLTVLDNSNKILFKADKDNKVVQIADYNVEADKLYSTKLITPGTPNETKKVSLDTGEITLEHVYTSGNITTAAIEGGAFTAKTLNSAEEVVDRGSVGIAGLESIHNTLIGNLVTQTQTVQLTPAGGLYVEDADVLNNTSDRATLRSDRLTFNDGNRNTSIRAYSLHHNAGTAEVAYTITLPAGIYMLIHGQYLAPNANAQGMQVLVIGTNSGSSSLVTTFTGSGSDLTATTGTRSQVTVGNSDGTSATLTWTVQGRGYRHLSMMRLY